MRSDLASGLYLGAQPLVSVFVVGTPATPPNFEIGGVVPAQVRTYQLERDDPEVFPYACVTTYDLVFDELPTDLQSYLRGCLRAACAAGNAVAWLGFEGSFHFGNILTAAIAPQIYGVCAPGREPAVVPDLEALKTPGWRSTVTGLREHL